MPESLSKTLKYNKYQKIHETEEGNGLGVQVNST